MHNARWFADVRVEALRLGVAVPVVDQQTDTILQAIAEAVAAGKLSQREADAAITEFGFVSGVPRVGPAVVPILNAFAAMHGGHYLSVLETYARGIEQALARARGDTAAAMNPQPRKDYADAPRRVGSTGGLLLLAASALLALGVRR
jgi:hypothetical protein